MPADLPTRVANAARPETRQFLLERGAGNMAHPAGQLFEHLLRTAVRLAEWEDDEPLVVAGLCHAVYGTDGFAPCLVELSNRDAVRALLGDEAEEIVYTYAAADRRIAWDAESSGRVHRDRFTGIEHELGEHEATAFRTLSASNELDLVTRTGDENVVPLLKQQSTFLLPRAREAVARYEDPGVPAK